MTPNRKFILTAVSIILIASLSVALLYLYGLPERQDEGFEKFEEVHETYVYVDEQGGATCQFTAQLLPSKLADALKLAVIQIGTSVIEQSYSESIRSGWAQFGLDVKNINCAITGLTSEENFKITMTWEIPNIARRRDNHWTISFDWVDNQSAAQDTISGLYSSWIVYQNISKNVHSYFYTKTIVVLPEGAENIVSPQINTSHTVDYGGESYWGVSFYTEQIEGRPAIVENGLTLFSTKNELTLTAEQLLENISFQTIEYDGAFPTDDWSFISSLGHLRLDLKYGRELDEQYSIFVGRTKYSFSPAQLLYYTADGIVSLTLPGPTSQPPTISVTGPSSEDGDLETFWGLLSQAEYLTLADDVCGDIASTGIAPGVIITPQGQIRFRDALLTFTRILSAYEDTGTLLDSIMLVPSPSGQLSWGNTSVPANYAYFLLPDNYVITGTQMVNEVLDNVYQPDYDNRVYANALSDWLHANITYTLITSPPNSERVLIDRKGQCRDYANAYLALLRTAEMPVKRMGGWIVTIGEWSPPAGLEPFTKGTTLDGQTIGSHAWAQVYLPDEGWTFADATWGYFDNVPYDIYQQQEQTWIDALAGYESTYGLL